MPTGDPIEGAKTPTVINVVPLLRWLWKTDRVQKIARRLRIVRR